MKNRDRKTREVHKPEKKEMKSNELLSEGKLYERENNPEQNGEDF